MENQLNHSTNMIRRKWDNEKLELVRRLVNKKFPKQKINSIKRMKEIIVEQEKLRGETAKNHNKNYQHEQVTRTNRSSKGRRTL